MQLNQTRRQVNRAFGAAGALALLGLVGATGNAGAQDPIFINMATTSNVSSHYPLAVAVGQSINQGTDGRIRANVLPGATAENIRRMQRDEIEMSLVAMETAYHAYKGVGSFEGEEPVSDLRALFVYIASPYIISVRADAGVEQFSDLAGKPVNPGVPGSGAVAQVRRIAELLEVDVDWREMALADAVAATKDGRLVGFVKSAASPTRPDATYLDISTSHDMELVGLPREAKDMLESEIPAFKTIEVPAGVYEGQDEPLLFGAAMVGYAVDTDMSEETAYEITKAIFENRDIQNAAMPAISDVDYFDYTIQYSTIPLHPGAIRYFEEQGHEVPDRLRAD